MFHLIFIITNIQIINNQRSVDMDIFLFILLISDLIKESLSEILKQLQLFLRL